MTHQHETFANDVWRCVLTCVDEIHHEIVFSSTEIFVKLRWKVLDVTCRSLRSRDVLLRSLNKSIYCSSKCFCLTWKWILCMVGSFLTISFHDSFSNNLHLFFLDTKMVICWDMLSSYTCKTSRLFVSLSRVSSQSSTHFPTRLSLFLTAC